MKTNVKLSFLGALIAFLSACAQVEAPATVQVTAFTATPTAAKVGDPITLSWQTSGAASCVLVTTASVMLEPETCAEGSSEVTFDAPGSYTARLEARAANGTQASRTATLVVTAAGVTTPSFESVSDGLSVTFTATPQTEGTRYLWDFGDGSQDEGEQVTHRYEGPGEYQVTLTLSSTEGEQQVTESVSLTSERLTLFGSDLSAWKRKNGGEANWRLGNDGSPYFEVVPGGSVGGNDIETREAFGDFRLHLEFWVPQTPSGNAEQAKGNSGVYLQGRYEVQILDSYDHPLSGENDAGAIYEVKDADSNASRPAETWQSYDIVFRAARYSRGEKTESARVSVTWNGQLVQDNILVPGPTRLGDNETGEQDILNGPIRLQDHGYGVRYRNIWLEPL